MPSTDIVIALKGGNRNFFFLFDITYGGTKVITGGSVCDLFNG